MLGLSVEIEKCRKKISQASALLEIGDAIMDEESVNKLNKQQLHEYIRHNRDAHGAMERWKGRLEILEAVQDTLLREEKIHSIIDRLKR